MNRVTFKRELLEWVRSIGLTVFVGAIIIMVARPSLIFGASMEPNFHDREVVLVEKVSYILDQPQKDDVIIVKSDIPLFPDADNELLKGLHRRIIKRVVGLPGDHVVITNNSVFVNDQLQNADFTKDGITVGEVDLVVPQNKVFILGDNRGNSNDSRWLGCIDFSDIQGKVYLRFLPFTLYP